VLENLKKVVDDRDNSMRLFGVFTGEIYLEGSNFLEIECYYPPTSRYSGALFARYMTLFERITAMSKEEVSKIYDRYIHILKKRTKKR
jgi:hypothetical protein